MTKPPYPDIATAITRVESDLLAKLTADQRVLEIGSYLGYSTVWMALNGAMVQAVDPHDWMDSRLAYEANLRRYGVQRRVVTTVARSQDARLPGGFDAAFIDGDLSYENAAFDLSLARRLVRPGGWIICHDYSFPGYGSGGWPGVVRAVDEVLGDLRERRRVGTIYAARVTDAARTAPGN